MIRIHCLESIHEPFENAVVTIGNFDGVHLGHQALMREVIRRASAIRGVSIAVTFDPHPVTVLQPEGRPPLITMTEQKAELIEAAGMDVLIIIPFDREFAAMPPEVFVRDILVARLGMKVLVVGGDYSFGKDRRGNLDFLRGAARKTGYELYVADWIQDRSDGHEIFSGTDKSCRISSTRIRELVMEGKMAEARKFLGRWYQVRGQVAHGRKRGGKLLDCPTANIELHDELAPRTGVYAVTVECAETGDAGTQRKYCKGVANIGYSPTFGDNAYTVEVHIFEFDESIYGRAIRVNFVKRLRDERKFDSIGALSAQIRKDIQTARTALEERVEKPAGGFTRC